MRRLLDWWKETGALLRALLFLLAISIFLSIVFLQVSRDDGGASSGNLFVAFILNLNILILSVLVFVVGRNIVRLVFDRRRNILGARLRGKLVAALVGITLIPTVFLFMIANGLINRAI